MIFWDFYYETLGSALYRHRRYRHDMLEVAHQQLLLGLAWRVPADGDGDDPRLLGRVLVVAGVLRPGVRLTVRPCNTTQLTTATWASNEG